MEDKEKDNAYDGSDRLSELLMLQRRLQEDCYHTDFDGMDNEERIAFIRQNVLALEDELHEALREVGWKSWARTKYVHETRLQEELIDALHFMLSLLLAANMDADEVYERYLTKNRINRRRQQEGYSGEKTRDEAEDR
jgi:dimeric dUTPase (all-alpha-NTP-PPase superfamily)